MFSRASAWTGGSDTITAPPPPLKSSRVEAAPIRAAVKSHMQEYTELAALVGVKSPDLGIEGFKEFLAANNITVFSLVEVITYMDAKAEKESKEKSGWEWRPLRVKDNRDGVTFGKAAVRDRDQYGQRSGKVGTPASDYYNGPREHIVHQGSEGFLHKSPGSSLPYDRPIPLHALRKVALIEKSYAGDSAFFVTDYALAPAVEYPDPFLMVLIPNLDVNKGVGRFVIDFWDEPGFGLDKQLMAP